MLSKEFKYQAKTRGSKLFQQGDKADYVYVIRSGDVRSYYKMMKPDYKQTDAKKIFDKPGQTNNQQSTLLTKNKNRLFELIDLGITG